MDPLDPYRPPQSDLIAGALPTAAAGGPLYSLRQITVATLLGGPLAGTLLMAHNARALGRGGSARNLVIAGVAASVVLLALSMLLPDRFPRSIVPVVYIMSLRSAAQASQGVALKKHFDEGGPAGSNWRLAGIALASMGGLVAVLCLLAAVLGASLAP